MLLVLGAGVEQFLRKKGVCTVRYVLLGTSYTHLPNTCTFSQYKLVKYSTEQIKGTN